MKIFFADNILLKKIVLLTILALQTAPVFCADANLKISDDLEKMSDNNVDRSLRNIVHKQLGHSDIFPKPYELNTNPDSWCIKYCAGFAKIFFNKEIEDIISNRKQLTQTCLEVFNNPNPEEINVIPSIHVRSWVTNINNPSEPTDDRTKFYLKSVSLQSDEIDLLRKSH
jgi:hypothetical protein